MLDVGPSPGEVDSLLVFVDRLGAAVTDPAAATAHERVRDAVRAGSPPPGLRRIAEGLSGAGPGELPPPPRRPADDPGSVVAAVGDNALLVLDDVEPAEVAAAVAALMDDGRRVIVTGPDPAALDAVCTALPDGVGDRVVGALPRLAPADLHRLRGLLATSTAERRARLAQQLPELGELPDAAEVTTLCAVALHPTPPHTERIAPLLAELDDERRAAVTAVAGCVQRALATLGARAEPWMWELLADLVHGRRRPAFDAIVQSAAQALATIDDGRDDPPVRVTGPLPDDAIDTIVAYLMFREGGGRTRGPFRSSAQRDVQPVLRQIRVGDRQPDTPQELRIVLTHFQLGERLVAVDADCAALGLPTPQNPTELIALSGALGDIGGAARSVGALRHDVLFLGANSPLAVPDVAAAEHLALAVLDYAGNGSAVEAGERLDALADAVAALAPGDVTAPEHARAVDALRARAVENYRAAVDDLARAHRELCDEQRTAALLAALGSSSLAAAWQEGTGPGRGHSARFGFAWFCPAAPLLEELPAADRADVIVVLDAGRLGMDRALLAAAAPRVVAAVAPGGRSGSGTLLGLLQRASALVIRGRAAQSRAAESRAAESRAAPSRSAQSRSAPSRSAPSRSTQSRAAGTTGRVLPLTPGPRALPVTEHDGVEQAGA